MPNEGKDPDDRYGLRGNGTWRFKPSLAAADYMRQIHTATNITAGPDGLHPAAASQPGEVVFKVQAANVIASQTIRASFTRAGPEDAASIAVSTDNGLHWTGVWQDGAPGRTTVKTNLVNEVNGAYEVLIRVSLQAKRSPADVCLRGLEIQTTTMLNAKTQPKLNLGRNAVYVGAGDPTESIVLWPELQGAKYKEQVVEEKNIASTPKHIGYQGTVYPAAAGEDAWLVYRLDAPADITRVSFGGRFYNRAPKSHVGLLYSLDAGRTWTKSWSLRRTSPPWDVIHYETVEIPGGHRSVWVKYLMDTTEAGPAGCSIYAVRMEANYLPLDTAFKPLEVTFNWSERQKDRTLVERSHTQTVPRLPFKYTINVGGEDNPVVNWLRVNPQGAVSGAKEGYSDGQDAGGAKFTPQWLTCGKNIAIGKPYTLSAPSGDNWGAGDPDGRKLTRGAGGPSYAGGSSYQSGALWSQDVNPVITLDLGAPAACASFGMKLHGYPWWDSLKGEVQDRVEVLTSLDGQEYRSQGFLKLNLFWKDLPVNYMWTDQETMTSGTFRLVPDRPVTTRFVQYRIRNRRFFDCAGLEVLDTIGSAPFDLRIALPDEAGPAVSLAPDDDGSERSGRPDAKSPPAPNGGTRAVVISQPASSGSELGANPMGEPVLEPSTLHSLGVYWIIRGDDNKNATVALNYRQAGAAEWRLARPLFRVEKGANRLERGESRVKVPSGAWLFAGSVVLLDPDTAYDLRLRLSDPDGGAAERILQARTATEPFAPAGSPQYHVVPGAGGGSGTRSDPYRGLAEAQARAKAGAIFLLHAGLYEGTFTVTRSGEPGRPIVWRGAGDGEAVLDGQGTQGRVIAASGTHDVWFEQLCLRNAQWGLVAHDAARVVIRRCHFYKVKSGITATRNDRGTLAGFFIADNLIEGPFSWPSEAKGAPVEEDRGIEISGAGQEVCYNRVRNFKDGIDTFPSQVCAAIDIHHNEVSECLDDGCEMDYSERNTRLFYNRFTDVFQGISVQPVFGGPVYVFRNVVYNIDVEAVKMHNSPSGALFFHNTFVKQGVPLLLLTSEPVRNSVYRNNLFIGAGGNYAYECDPPMIDCDFDYDGFGGGPWKLFLKWNQVRYATAREVREEAPVYRHVTVLDAASVFASGIQPPGAWAAKFDGAAIDLRLKPGTPAIDAGEVLPGFNDGYKGKAPDLGAYELGDPLPHYGPRNR